MCPSGEARPPVCEVPEGLDGMNVGAGELPPPETRDGKTMNSRLSGLGLVLVVAASGPAMAGGDVIYQGFKDPAAAIPVPAPIPVEIYEPDYYVRFDVGGAWLSDGTFEEIGTPIEIREPGDIEAIEFGSIGAGRYITPSIRVELAVDLFNRAEIALPNTLFYQDTRSAAGPDFVDPVTGNTFPTTDTSTYDVERTEQVRYEQNLGLINFYYDFRNSSRFTPYVGAGFGVTYRELSRRAIENAECVVTDNSNPTIDAGYGPNFCRNTTDLPAEFRVVDEQTRSRWDFAAAAMAGFSYEVYDNVLVDAGYRYVWQSGSLSLTLPTVSGNSRVDISDVGQHQFRTGIRLNLE